MFFKAQKAVPSERVHLVRVAREAVVKKEKKKENVMLMLYDIVFCTLRMLYIAVYKLTPNIRRPLACRTGEENYVEMGVAGNI